MEEVTVLELSTGTSVQNIRELRDYIKGLKEDLDREDQSLEQNAATAEELRAAQAALRDTMYASTKSVEDLTASTAKLYDENGDLTASYNDLVHQLADLKSAWRATTDEAERAKLTDEIKRVNDSLKELDYSTGNFSRNVGNYANSFKEAFGDLPPFLGQTKTAVENVTKSLDLVGKQPVLGLLMLLAPIIQKITEALKENKTAMDAVQKVLKALQPVMDFFSGIIEKIAGLFSRAVDRVLEWAGESSGAFRTIVAGAVGVGNAILQFIITPVRQTIDAVKGLGNVLKDVFSGDFKKAVADAKAAGNAITENFRKGLDFKGNFEAGKAAGDAFIEGLGSTKSKAKKTGSDVGKAAKDALEEALTVDPAKLAAEMDKIIAEADKKIGELDANIQKKAEDARKTASAREKERLADIDKAAQEALRWNEIQAENDRAREENAFEIQQAADQRKLDAMRKFAADALEAGDLTAYLDYQQQAADLEVQIAQDAADREKAIRQQQAEDALTIAETYVSGLSSVLSSVADIYESMADGTADAENKIKGIRIAAATIDTISGAIAAYMNGVKTIPVPSWAGIALGVAQAAVVTAAGLANIAKIRATQIQGGSGSGAGGTAQIPAFAGASAVEAPSAPQSVQEVAAVENARNTASLNQSVRDQRVYILQSDLEASGRQVSVREAETTF
ncbi:MAG: hypothetical protein IKR32_02600 [Bacteroidales bacterium]|nr:hypothetical protein [Bacteroidales bacterium]